MVDGWEILGLVAGALTAFATLPQSVRIIRTHDASAVSAFTYILLLASYALWLIYGIGKEAVSIILWNVMGLALGSFVLYLKLYVWNHKKP